MAVFGTLHCIAQFAIIFIPNYYVRLAGFAVMGACQLKNSVCYMWLFGLIQRKHTSVCCGLLNAWDTLTLTVLTVYFLYFSKNWFPLILATTALGFLGNTIMMFIPDCPAWLL